MITEYLDMPAADRLISLKKDMRQISSELHSYSSGFVETAYLHRAMESTLYPENDNERIGFNRPPSKETYDDYRDLIAELLSVHAPEPHQLGFGWSPTPHEAVSLRYLSMGDVREGVIHWSNLREHKVVLRVNGPWNSINHGYRIVVIDFKKGELHLLKREYHDVDKTELGIEDGPDGVEMDIEALGDDSEFTRKLGDSLPDGGQLTLEEVRARLLASSPLLTTEADADGILYPGPYSRMKGVGFTKDGLTYDGQGIEQNDVDADDDLDLQEQLINSATKLTIETEEAALEGSEGKNTEITRTVLITKDASKGIPERIPTASASALAADIYRREAGLTDENFEQLFSEHATTEKLRELDEIATFLPFHPDLYQGAFWPPRKIHFKLGTWLSSVEREMIFVAPVPRNVHLSFRIPGALREALEQFPGLNFSSNDSFAQQAAKLRFLLPNEDIRKLHVQVAITDDEGAVQSSQIFTQRDLATADVDVDERRITLSPHWLAVLKQVLWPKPMMAIATNIFWPYERPEGAIHMLKPSETSPLTELKENTPHIDNQAPHLRLLEEMKDVPDLEKINPTFAKLVDDLMSAPGFDMPLPSVSGTERDPFDVDAINTDPENPENAIWKVIHEAHLRAKHNGNWK